jgi:hypothetical protein
MHYRMHTKVCVVSTVNHATWSLRPSMGAEHKSVHLYNCARIRMSDMHMCKDIRYLLFEHCTLSVGEQPMNAHSIPHAKPL